MTDDQMKSPVTPRTSMEHGGWAGQIGRCFGRVIHREGRGVESDQGEILPVESLAANPWETALLD
jgi:hypothetical protein